MLSAHRTNHKNPEHMDHPSQTSHCGAVHPCITFVLHGVSSPHEGDIIEDELGLWRCWTLLIHRNPLKTARSQDLPCFIKIAIPQRHVLFTHIILSYSLSRFTGSAGTGESSISTPSLSATTSLPHRSRLIIKITRNKIKTQTGTSTSK